DAPFESESARRVVRESIVEHLTEKPEQLLRVGERSRPVALARDYPALLRCGCSPCHQSSLKQGALSRREIGQAPLDAGVHPPFAHRSDPSSSASRPSRSVALTSPRSRPAVAMASSRTVDRS